MNSEAVSALLAKMPTLKPAKSKLEAMVPGAYVVHRSWGFGQIRSYDESAQRLTIDFKGKAGHAMDPAFCVSTMEVLHPRHLLVRRETEAARINELIANQPAQLVVEALQAYPNQAATAIELEIVLAQVLGEEKFKKWWAAARKQIAQDARLSVPVKKTECYIVRETPVSAEDGIREQFTSTRSARRRITLAEELMAAVDGKASPGDLGAILDGLAESVRESNQLDAAERLYGAAVRDDLAKLLGRTEAFEPAQATLIANTRDRPGISEKIPVHFQGRFLRLIRDTHPIEARDVLFQLLKT